MEYDDDDEYMMDETIKDAVKEAKIEMLQDIKQMWKDSDDLVSFGDKLFKLLDEFGLI